MHAVWESPRRVSERAESRLFYVTVSEKRAEEEGRGGARNVRRDGGGEGGMGRWGRREIEEEREKRN